MTSTFTLRQLTAADVDTLRGMLSMFAAAFEAPDQYLAHPPDDDYLRRLLSNPHFIALAAHSGSTVIGGLAAYELPKFEQARSEIYLYDLAVDAAHRRRGVAMALIGMLQRLAAERGAYVVFVQADYGDDAAVSLYTRLGTREDVMHFDIPPRGDGDAPP